MGTVLCHWSESRAFLSSFFWGGKLPVRNIRKTCRSVFSIFNEILGFYSYSRHGRQMGHRYRSILLFCLWFRCKELFNRNVQWCPFSYLIEFIRGCTWSIRCISRNVTCVRKHLHRRQNFCSTAYFYFLLLPLVALAPLFLGSEYEGLIDAMEKQNDHLSSFKRPIILTPMLSTYAGLCKYCHKTFLITSWAMHVLPYARYILAYLGASSY